MSDSLFVLTNQYLELASKLSNLDLDAETVADTIEASGIVDSLTDKATAIEHVARGAEAHNAAIDAEIARLQALKAHRVKVASGLRQYLLDNMLRMQIEKIECPLFQISIRKNPPSVDVFDTINLPSEYMVVPEPKPPVAAPDKKRLAIDLKAGKEITGARLVQGVHLNIA
jgi:hypothetical protein